MCNCKSLEAAHSCKYCNLQRNAAGTQTGVEFTHVLASQSTLPSFQSFDDNSHASHSWSRAVLATCWCPKVRSLLLRAATTIPMHPIAGPELCWPHMDGNRRATAWRPQWFYHDICSWRWSIWRERFELILSFRCWKSSSRSPSTSLWRCLDGITALYTTFEMFTPMSSVLATYLLYCYTKVSAIVFNESIPQLRFYPALAAPQTYFICKVLFILKIWRDVAT
jgi:hypothetical protein